MVPFAPTIIHIIIHIIIIIIIIIIITITIIIGIMKLCVINPVAWVTLRTFNRICPCLSFQN
jgi:hypothetical protein